MKAIDYVLPFGKHKGKTLFQISQDDPKYLDWAAGEMEGRAGDAIREAVKHPDIERKIDAALND